MLQTSRASQNQPSAHQLRMLVQQIQMAVSAGYLNHQVEIISSDQIIFTNEIILFEFICTYNACLDFKSTISSSNSPTVE